MLANCNKISQKLLFMILVHSKAVPILPSGTKKDGKIVLDYFVVLAIILPLVWSSFCLSWENRHLPICEWSCILCPNVQNFCPNNCQFFSVGDATASPRLTLMVTVVYSDVLEGKRSTCFGPLSRYFVLKYSSLLVKSLLSAHIIFSEPHLNSLLCV